MSITTPVVTGQTRASRPLSNPYLGALVEETDETQLCMYEDCESEATNLMRIDPEHPIGSTCQEHADYIQAQLKANPNMKIGVDVHFHPHVILSLVEVDAQTIAPMMGQMYANDTVN